MKNGDPLYVTFRGGRILHVSPDGSDMLVGGEDGHEPTRPVRKSEGGWVDVSTGERISIEPRS